MSEVKPLSTEQIISLGDNGPIYTETDPTHFPVEPYNTSSLMIFLFISIYWTSKIWGKWKQHLLITISIPLLLIGCVGGVMYHACRCSNVWFYLDIFPIAILAVLGGCTFWQRLFQENKTKFNLGAFVTIIGFLFSIFLRQYLSKQLAISTSYICMAIIILFPGVLLSANNSWKHLSSLIAALLLFGIAIIFRIIDFEPFIKQNFPMGTHFLWHIFGALCGFFLLNYIYLTSKTNNSINS